MKSPTEIYQAMIQPDHMQHYFISEASGIMEEGKEITWKFPEFKEEFQINVLQLIPDELIVFSWPGMEDHILEVKIALEAVTENTCIVSISEGEAEHNESGIAWLSNNSAGWANFLACLKAYLEFGINLRKGGFDFMSDL